MSIHVRLQPRGANQALTMLAGVGVVAVGMMWWHHTPTSLPNASFVALAVGRLAGLLVGLSSMCLLVLMARVGPLERAVGADQLARLHARLGRYTILLLIIHVPLVVWGYAGATRMTVREEVGILWRDYPYIWLAVLGASLLLVVGLTSVRKLRQRFDYEVWYFTHLLTYVAVALAFGHQITVGSDFVHNRVERVLWVTCYLLVGATVIYWRLIRGLLRAYRRRATVSEVVIEPGGVTSVLVRTKTAEAINAQSGHFFRLRFLTRDLWWESHPYSLSAAPGADSLRFSIKALGRHSRAISELPIGTRVLLAGPYGTLTVQRRTRPDVLLIAGGIGITPLRALFESFEAGELILIYRCRDEQHILFRHELDALAAARAGHVIYLPGSREQTADRLSAAGLAELVPDVAERDVFICAPTPMMTQLADTLRTLGVPPGNVHWEAFELIESGPSPPRRLLAIAASIAVLTLILGIRSDMFTRAGRVVLLGPVPAAVAQPAAKPSVNAAGEMLLAGPIERTLYAEVQVQVTMKHGRLVDVTALLLPNRDARSRQLSAMAAPILRREALASGGSRVDAVTGATYTSGAYQQSLVGALSKAIK
jgi:predicted ferric reductase